MTMLALLFFLVCFGVPVGLYLLRESRYRDPAHRWPKLAEQLGFAFQAGPPATLSGQWKGRAMRWSGSNGRAVLETPLSPGASARLLIGPKAEAEKAAGIVVPDRVSFAGDAKFDERFLVRATPPEAGELAVDPTVRRRLMAMGEVWIQTEAGRFQMRLAVPSEADDMREAMDVAVSLAEAIDRT